MNNLSIKAGSVDISVVIRIIDSTDGTPETGVVFNTSGIDLEYRREGAASTDITEATLAALTTAHTDGGFLHIGNGYYRLDLPDAAVASGAAGVLVHGTVTGMVVIGCYIQLVAYDPFDTVRFGLTALPNAAAEAAGGLYTRGTGAGQINQPANGLVDVNVERWNATAVPAEHTAGYPIVTIKDGTGTGEIDTASGVVLAKDHTGANLALASALATVQADTDDIQARIPAALVSGRMDVSVGAMAANVLTATAINADAITAAKIADGAIDANTFATGAITAAAVAADAIGASELAADAVAEIADQVWDEVLSGHLTAGSTGSALNSAGSAGDPWGTALPGAYGAGTAGKIVGDNLNATVSSRATQTSVDTIDDFLDTEVAAIKAKTDNLPGVVKKNTALSNFTFVMYDSTDHVTPKTGLTLTSTRSIDGAAFGACANAASEVANGVYKINLSAADLNGDVITLKFTATGADQTTITILTVV